MKNTKILLSIFGGVVVVVVAVVGYFLYQGITDTNSKKRQRDSEYKKLQGFYNYNPFPNTANVDAERENLGKVAEWQEMLLTELKAFPLPPSSNDPIEFSSKRESVTRELLALAPSGVVPAAFGFGFDRYKGGELANPADVSRLMRQLYMIDILAREMYAANIKSLSSVTREEFDGAKIAEGTSRTSAQKPPVASTAQGDVGIAMTKEEFTFKFVVSEEGLVDVLNRLAKTTMFVVIKHLEVGKVSGGDYTLAPPLKEGDGKDVGVKNPRPPSRLARQVSGQGREIPVSVNLSVDVYSF